MFPIPGDDNVSRSEESLHNGLRLVDPLQPVTRDDGWTPGSPQQRPSVVTSGAVTASTSHHGSDGVLVLLVLVLVIVPVVEEGLEGSLV